jgi:uncharacterized protein YecT (DUF1311 family)
MRVRAIVALAALALADAAAAQTPSFDCKRARTKVETTICADAALAQLDAALATAYRAAVARARSDKALLSALKREHAAFLSSREAALETPGATLPRFMQSWWNWLEAVGAPRKGFEGAWISGAGSLVVERRPAGGYKVVANGDEAIRGAYACEFSGIGRLKGERLEASWDTSGGGEDGAEGWTLDLQRRTGLLRVDQRRNESEAATAPFCGAHGSLEGDYLPARLRPRPVRAWQAAGG